MPKFDVDVSVRAAGSGTPVSSRFVVSPAALGLTDLNRVGAGEQEPNYLAHFCFEKKEVAEEQSQSDEMNDVEMVIDESGQKGKNGQTCIYRANMSSIISSSHVELIESGCLL